MGVTRRTFIQQTAAGVGAAATAGAVPAIPAEAVVGDEFRSRWDKQFDRVWLGEHYWANPLQDWRIAGGRQECVKAAPNRNVHLLTRRLGKGPGEFRMSVKLGRIGAESLAEGRGAAGFSIGVRGPLDDYRNSLIFGRGLDAGIMSDGQLVLGDDRSAKGAIDLGRKSVELRLEGAPTGAAYRLTLSVHDGASGELLGQQVRDGVPADRLAGNVALAVNFSTPAAAGGAKKANRAGAAKKLAAAAQPGGDVGRFWFADWRLGGAKVETNDEHAFGPILFSQYTLSRGVLKLTAQMPPLGEDDSQTVALQLQKDATEWEAVAEEVIHPEARTVTFRIDPWDASLQFPYRLVYTQKYADGSTSAHHWEGVVRRDPVEKPVFTVADISCNIHAAFPNVLYTSNVTRLDPDLLAFVGDQFYESSGGYGIQREPLAESILDYLRKWYMHGWTWRELTRDRPSISIPDDHDVYQGNLWGEGCIPAEGVADSGGYSMPAPWVNVVHRTQTSHHPDPWDASCGQNVSVYAGPLVYGRIGFAILADRQFKSGPAGKVPPAGGRADHVTDPNFDPATADLPGLQLLGESQLNAIRKWAADWRGVDMKAVISQTIFTAVATTHGGERQRLVADYDANGWPQGERNAALREIRKAFAFHLAGDQHLPAVIHYGIEEHGDAGLAFAGPAVNAGYPRWFEPAAPGANRKPGAPENTGEFRDSFGHPLTVLAVANGAVKPRSGVLEQLHDKSSGLGLVRFDKQRRKLIIECWPLLGDVTDPQAQFPGWPITIDVIDNYGRKAIAYLPVLRISGVENPVVEVTDQAGEIVYSLRIDGREFQPHVFAEGKYTVKIGDPDAERWRTMEGLEAKHENGTQLDVEF
jgi:hypothetical protein